MRPRHRREPDDQETAPAGVPLDVKREVKQLRALLQREGLQAFRAAFASGLGRERPPIPPGAANGVVQIVKELPAPDGAEAAAELTAWLLQGEELEIAERSLWRLVNLLNALGAAEACEEHLSRSAPGRPLTLLLLAMLRCGRGAVVESRRLFEQALAAGLPPQLEDLAKAELCATQFHRIGPPRPGGGKGVALLEPKAATDLLRSALAEVESLRAFAGNKTALTGIAGLEAALTEGRLGTGSFRFVADRTTYDAAALFSRRLLERALPELGESLRLEGAEEEQLEGFHSALTLRYMQRMVFAFNALECLQQTQAEAGRVFLVVDDGWLAVPLAEQIAAEGRQELWVASGSSSPRSRRRFAAALDTAASLDSLRALRDDDSDEGKDDNEPAGSPLLEVTPARLPRQGRRPCLICTHLPESFTAGSTRALPLQELIERLLPEWDPMILLIKGGHQDKDRALADLQAMLGPLLPQVRIVALNLRAAFGATSLSPALRRTLDSLLLDPAVQGIELGGLPLAHLLRAPSQGFIASLLKTAAVTPWLEELLQSWAPQVILTSRTQDLSWKYLQLAARRQGIPTLAFQNSAVGANPWTPAPDADHYLCFDAHSHAIFADSGRLAPERASAIGSIRWDAALRRARRFDRRAERDALGLDAGQKLVLLATQPLDMEDNHTLVALTLTALRDLPEAFLVVKLHPAESGERLAAIEGQLRRSPLAERARALLAYDTYRLLAAADLVVNVSSNVGLEAALLDLDVVSVETSPEIELFSLSELGLVAPARDRETAIAQIRGLLRDPEQRVAARALRDAYFDLNPQLRDGRALERLAAALAEAAEAGRAGSWKDELRWRPLGRAAAPNKGPGEG